MADIEKLKQRRNIKKLVKIATRKQMWYHSREKFADSLGDSARALVELCGDNDKPLLLSAYEKIKDETASDYVLSVLINIDNMDAFWVLYWNWIKDCAVISKCVSEAKLTEITAALAQALKSYSDAALKEKCLKFLREIYKNNFAAFKGKFSELIAIMDEAIKDGIDTGTAGLYRTFLSDIFQEYDSYHREFSRAELRELVSVLRQAMRDPDSAVQPRDDTMKLDSASLLLEIFEQKKGLEIFMTPELKEIFYGLAKVLEISGDETWTDVRVGLLLDICERKNSLGILTAEELLEIIPILTRLRTAFANTYLETRCYMLLPEIYESHAQNREIFSEDDLREIIYALGKRLRHDSEGIWRKKCFDLLLDIDSRLDQMFSAEDAASDARPELRRGIITALGEAMRHCYWDERLKYAEALMDIYLRQQASEELAVVRLNAEALEYILNNTRNEDLKAKCDALLRELYERHGEIEME
jgi:hypothetical protein